MNIYKARAAATFIENMQKRRFPGVKDAEKVDYGWGLAQIIKYFVSTYKMPYYSGLNQQFKMVLIEKGAGQQYRFAGARVQELYENACAECGIEKMPQRNPNVPRWPDGFYSGVGADVHLLDGTGSVAIGPWIEAVANVTDESDKHVGILVRFLNGKWIEHLIELEHLSSDGSKMFQALEEAGYRMSGDGRKARAALRRLIQDSESEIGLESVMRYSRPGWHGDKFVLPTGATASGEKAFVTGGVAAAPGGTHEEWCEHIRDEIWQGDVPQMAVGILTGFAGIISSRLMCDHPGIYFTGPPASGKTTSQIIGAGTVGNPAEGQGLLCGVNDEIDAHPGLGSCIHVDDPTKRPSLASAKKIESLVYGLYGCTAFTISSVLTLERLIEKAKGMMSEGVRRRVLTIDTTGIELIDIGRAMAIKSAAKRYYGHAAPIFAEYVASWSVDDLHKRVQQGTSLFIAGGKTNDPELYGIAWIAGLLLSAAQIGEICELVPEGGAEQIFPFLQDAVEAWQARRREGSGLAVIEGLVSEARPLGECQEGQVWIGQDRDGEGSARVLYVRTDRLDRGQLRQIKAANKLLELNDNNVAHNYLPRPDGRFIRHYRVRAMTPSVQPAEAA